MDSQAERKEYVERVERAVNALPWKERVLIQERYMSADSEYITDYAVYNHRLKPAISEGTYSKYRWKAFYKIALKLNIEVLKHK
ncbi:hypothetical protein P4V43_09250 [Brevibacillus fortis]|nr:hypothetical protein [Brevibacillus fortis]